VRKKNFYKIFFKENIIIYKTSTLLGVQRTVFFLVGTCAARARLNVWHSARDFPTWRSPALIDARTEAPPT